MVELVLRDAGWNAHSLGTNLPLSELIPAIDHYKPRLCWVSSSYTESPKRLRDQLLNLLEAGRIRNVNVVCGGRALPEDVLEDSSVCSLGSLQELQRHIVDLA
jgi:methanogenic corrinoid protein MtbC1